MVAKAVTANTTPMYTNKLRKLMCVNKDGVGKQNRSWKIHLINYNNLLE